MGRKVNVININYVWIHTQDMVFVNDMNNNISNRCTVHTVQLLCVCVHVYTFDCGVRLNVQLWHVIVCSSAKANAILLFHRHFICCKPGSFRSLSPRMSNLFCLLRSQVHSYYYFDSILGCVHARIFAKLACMCVWKFAKDKHWHSGIPIYVDAVKHTQRINKLWYLSINNAHSHTRHNDDAALGCWKQQERKRKTARLIKNPCTDEEITTRY